MWYKNKAKFERPFYKFVYKIFVAATSCMISIHTECFIHISAEYCVHVSAECCIHVSAECCSHVSAEVECCSDVPEEYWP